MKTIITILLLTINTVVFSQKDTTKAFPDSIPIISIKDILPLYEKLKELPHKNADPFIKYIEQLVAFRTEEYNKKKKTK